LDAPGVTQAAERLGRSKYAAGIDPGTGELHQSGWRFSSRRDRLKSWFSIRLSGGGFISEPINYSGQALYEQQDLAAMAQKLGAQLSADRKIMLGVQLYDLIRKPV